MDTLLFGLGRHLLLIPRLVWQPLVRANRGRARFPA